MAVYDTICSAAPPAAFQHGSSLPPILTMKNTRKDCSFHKLPTVREFIPQHTHTRTPKPGHDGHADFYSAATPAPTATKLRPDMYWGATHIIPSSHLVLDAAVTKLTAHMSFWPETDKTAPPPVAPTTTPPDTS